MRQEWQLLKWQTKLVELRRDLEEFMEARRQIDRKTKACLNRIKRLKEEHPELR